ncbi:hypothetical protein METBIDRAFT_45067 [Metschnikowia bicuspidata var. bicuspidata NRRL YB-4993]|uniref:F-box domain-containing protein n=1 Tax=Metschnikowia bicuspidata var. bicuspidata NRRL YB-4993 TaxID=869754 RepID=A0A1A0H7R4_9ASCO|nr:hypothetical protein METBIDRAFT_45067 [Metschnikowia bicuspidata var. bicuspidata NRRL YB-4993]OBA20139.1 hypothetical protein METBIDRAFT_45067 [Metschnikowia bicuspidata var. bicuspidata NRRL YB-4993]
MPLESARTSLSFRQGNDKQLSLEQLPVLILETIFNLLQTPDLLVVCSISKDFYFAALNCVYRSICITDDSLTVQYYKKHTRRSNGYYCTIMPSRKIEALLEVVSNNRTIAAMIHRVKIIHTEQVSLIPRLLSYLRLKSFVYAGPLKIPPESTHDLHTLQLCLLSVYPCARNLRELKVNHFNQDSDFEQYGRLALSLIELDSYRNIRKLAFEHLEDRSLNLLNTFNIERHTAIPRPSWVGFFEAFSKRGIILNLAALSLDGNVGNLGELAAQIIGLAVQLSELQTLEARQTEHSHPGQAHSVGMMTFLDSITKFTPLLQYLSMRHTDNCLTCQIKTITHILRDNIPHQLKQLVIKFEPRTIADSDRIERLILSYQRNLQKIDYEDRSSSISDLTNLAKALDTQQQKKWLDDWYYGEKTREIFTPHILSIEGPRPYINDEKKEMIKICGKQILSFLNSNTLYKGALKHLPFLTEYCVFGLHVNVKSCGVFANGETILLE